MPLLLAVAFSIFPTATPPSTAGRFGLYGWLRMLVVSYFSNLVGALLLVGLPGVGWKPCMTNRAWYLKLLPQSRRTRCALWPGSMLPFRWA